MENRFSAMNHRTLLTGLGAIVVLVITTAVVVGQVAPTPRADTQTLIVFAAASLTDAFTEIGAAFESAHPGVTVTLNVASSSTLAAQIVEGAPADVFASANPRQMAVIAEAGRRGFSRDIGPHLA